MNITKAIAKQVAKKMVKPIAESISNEIDTLNEVIKNIAVRNIPKQVYDTYKRYPDYFYTTFYVMLVNGPETKMVSTEELYPNPRIILYAECTPEESDKVSQIQEKIEKLKDEKQETYIHIIMKLLQLRTSKKVKDLFPDAYEYIMEYEENRTTEI